MSPGEHERPTRDYPFQQHQRSWSWLTPESSRLSRVFRRMIKQTSTLKSRIRLAVCAVVGLLLLFKLSDRSYNFATMPELLPQLDTKVVVGITVGKPCIERVTELIRAWGTVQFHYMLFHFDDSDWSNTPFYGSKAVTHIRENLLKMQFYKKYISPEEMDKHGWKFFFLVDCDTGFDEFDVQDYLSIVEAKQLLLSQPAVTYHDIRERSSDHRICRQITGDHLGRWSWFVEGGPMAVFSREAWGYVLDLMQDDLKSGWGLDRKWCHYVHMRAGRKADDPPSCAIIDFSPVQHLDEKSAKKKLGTAYQVCVFVLCLCCVCVVFRCSTSCS
jgi:hypothetical protein